MSRPPLPSGYDVTTRVEVGHPDCQLTVGLDRQHGYVPRFLVQLQYRPEGKQNRWQVIVRMAHDETSPEDHDIYREGLYVDVTRRTSPEVHLQIGHRGLTPSRGALLRRCLDYIRTHTTYFVDVFEERSPPESPPPATDGGRSAYMFLSVSPLSEGMGRGSAGDSEDVLTLEEMTQILAEAEQTTTEEIIQRAEEMDLAPPWEAAIPDE